MTAAADDEMIVNRNVQGFRRVGDVARHVDVGASGRRVAARMIVHQNYRRSAELERALDDLARIDGRVVDRAACQHFVGDEYVLAIEEEDSKLLPGTAGHRGRAIVDQRAPGTKRGLVEQFGLGEAKGGASTIFS